MSGITTGRTMQAVFRRDIGVTVGGGSAGAAGSGQALTGGLTGPWTFRVPSWANFVQLDGCGGGGGGGEASASVAGGGGGSGVFVKGLIQPVLPGEILSIGTHASVAGGVGNIAHDTFIISELFAFYLPGGEQGNTGGVIGRGGRSCYFDVNARIGDFGPAHAEPGPGSHGRWIAYDHNQAQHLISPVLSNVMFGGQGGHPGAASSTAFPGSTIAPMIGMNSMGALGGAGSGGTGGMTPFSKLPTRLAGLLGQSALNQTIAANGFGMGGAGAGVGAGLLGGSSGPGLWILTFMEQVR